MTMMDKSDNNDLITINGSNITSIVSNINHSSGNERELVSILRKTKKFQQSTEMTSTTTSSEEKVRSSQANKRADLNKSQQQEENVNQTTTAQQPATRLFQSSIKRAQKPRRRVATIAQRRAANIRERRRMFNLNAAFDRLRKRVPSFAYEKRLSRIETLKLAIMYIRFMDDLVNDDAYAEKYKQLIANSQMNQTSSAVGSSSVTSSANFFSSNSYLSLYGHHTGSPTTDDTISKSSRLHQHVGGEQGTLLKSTIKGDCLEGCCVTNTIHHHASDKNIILSRYRVGQAQVLSPTSSSGGQCCSSPGASSIMTTTTCHSSASSSTFTESPNSSPISAQPPPLTNVNGVQNEQAYSYQQQQLQQYPVTYEQFQDNLISSISPYYGCEQIKSIQATYANNYGNNSTPASSKPLSDILVQRPPSGETNYASRANQYQLYQHQPARQEHSIAGAHHQASAHYSLHSLQAR